jgi:L-aspartate oxidase
VQADFLIIGSGIAGLRAAIDLAPYGRVVVLTKADPTESNTGYAQGGIAAAVGPDDSPEQHFADTMAAGDGLCEETAVRVLVEDGITYVEELVRWGVQFDRDAGGELALGREAAHRARRVLHTRDATGREIGRLLWSRVSLDARVTVLNHTRATALDVRDGCCVGAEFDEQGSIRHIGAGATLVATGGAGQVFSETTNPSIATGDGVALAWEAGARVADLEFVQFHPTALAVPGAPRFLLSEALRGEGARLLNDAGERFMTRYERAGDLASRDLVARAIVREIERTNRRVYLSLQHLDAGWVHARFPTISEAVRLAGLDLAVDLIPVGPAAHYMMGGVETDIWARTTLPGLYAAGEVACTGVHGANRLASNSLLEGLVFGARAAKAMQEAPKAGAMENVRVWDVESGRSNRLRQGSGESRRSSAEAEDRPLRTDGQDRPIDSDRAIDSDIRHLLWNNVGLSRNATALAQAVAQLDRWRHQSTLATVGWLIAKAALRREESRGGHYREDFPKKDDINWRFHIAEGKSANDHGRQI